MNSCEKSKFHHNHEIYTKNVGECYLQSELPLPPSDGFSIEIKYYSNVSEPK